MIESSALGLATAFVAGAISFLSPCVLPLVPAYVSYVAGHSLDGRHAVATSARISAMVMSVFFVLGFSTVFVALGASATMLGSLLLRYRTEANVVGGIVVIVFGLFMLGVLNRVRWLQYDVRFHPRLTSGNPLAAYILGLAFGFGWTPCIGPVLGAVLTMSAVQSEFSSGIRLLAAYALGLGVPFLLSALFLRELIHRFKTFRKAGSVLQNIAGVVMIVMGVAMLTGKLSAFSYWLLKVFPTLGTIG